MMPFDNMKDELLSIKFMFRLARTRIIEIELNIKLDRKQDSPGSSGDTKL